MVDRDCLFINLKYDLLMSKLGARLTGDRNLSDKQVNESGQKLVLNLHGTEELEMIWWRRGADKNKLRYSEMERYVSAHETNDLPVANRHISVSTSWIMY